MASEELDLVQPRRAENGLSSRMVFQGDAFPFSRGDGDHAGARKSRAVGAPASGFAVDGDKIFSGNRDPRFFSNQSWGAVRDEGSPSGDGSDGEEEDEEDDGDDDDEDVDEGDGLVSVDDGNYKANNNSSGSVQSSSEKIHDDRANSQERHSSFGLSRGVVAKDGNGGRGNFGEQQYQQGRMDGYENAIAVVDPHPYSTHAIHGGEGSTSAQKEVGGENGCGFSGRREVGLTAGYWESLRAHLSDPITGALMDDAMILSCGHSFGSTGMQHIYRMKACYECHRPISEDSVRPNLALRSAVQAFRREEESQSSKSSKRRRDRFEQDKCSFVDPFPVDFSRGKGVQFPFSVSDRVIIKGNKRTPQRFVGRVAVVTTQCLNGWYVVKTLDNAESVKLQYRSLTKVTDDQVSNMISNKPHAPNWL
ncbi:U-box domain-containing protein 62-like [Phoenix dactylifera]|uniref:U-box domain-containing protein 62-like n=1 Tax=Phoenix dactylifera TaxID=42345 RepID=A0A8B7BZH8_PHODC|nr:U-box domain-containing protein 62-like [Phoenix dactylifera]